MAQRPRRITPASTAVVAGGYIAVVAALDPFRPGTVLPSAVQCPVHAVTGLWCPGCGSTRAVHALTEGDLALSLASHPLVLPVAALLLYLWVRWAVIGHGAATRLPPAVPLTLAAAFVALTVARNVGLVNGPPLL